MLFKHLKTLYSVLYYKKSILYYFGKNLIQYCFRFLNKVIIKKYDLELTLSNVNYLLPIFNFLKNYHLLQYKILTDIAVVDYFFQTKGNRFEINYLLLSINFNSRVIIKVTTNEIIPLISSVSFFKNASWLEREVWDMYGIYFIGHPDLRRILTDYTFEGYPLRKDFPLTGFTEIIYDETKHNILYKNVALTQEYRIFFFLNPWNSDFYKKKY